MNRHANSLRLAEPYGLYLDRSQPITFQFDGKTYTGFKGDTIASALMANGVKIISRSFKYHRPRGVLSMAGQDGNTLVQIGDEPNVRADVRSIEEGMTVTAQNVIGSLKNDYGRILDACSHFLPVGFYYKAFYKPKGAWKFWEPIIRRLAGLGKINVQATPEQSDKQYRFADVAVIGAGPAGLAAAFQSAGLGAEVILIDDNPYLGGSLNYARFRPNYDQVSSLRETLVKNVQSHPRITILCNATCTGWFDDNWLAVITENRLIKLRANSVVAATGSFEQPAVFRHNDLPGVMLGSAAQRLIRLYGVKPGHSTVVLTSNDDGYGVALDLIEAGIPVNMVVDMRANETNTDLVSAVKQQGIQVLSGYTVTETIPGSGMRSIKGVHVDKIIGEGKVAGNSQIIHCDLLCMSVGYTPAAQLLCHSGARLDYDEADAMLKFKDGSLSDNAVIAGSVNAVFDLDAVVEDGTCAGHAAARLAGYEARSLDVSPDRKNSSAQNHPWPIFSHAKGKEFVDFDEDLQIKDIQRAVAEGYDDLELVKRYSTVVMGPSQGRQSALNNLRIATKAAKKSIQGLTITTQRPPFYPEPIQLLAGQSFQPLRRTAIHHRHIELGAQMTPAGLWHRPAYYGSPEKRQHIIEQEALAVRNNAGLIDVSTLGKLEIRGSDAAEFMNRMYTFAYVKQPVNRLRYVLMTDETGAIIDDGIAARFSQQHFYVTTTTAGVDNVYRTMLRWNAQWCLDVDITNVTSAYAAISLAGPYSRAVLQKFVTDVDLSVNGFKYSEVRCGHVMGIPARFLRVGFVGELGWEIHVPSSQGEALWDGLLEEGGQYGCIPVGIEAQRLLRLEKAHIIVGQDTDGLTIPHEANMAWAIADKKPFFIGKRAIDVLAGKELNRKLVGFSLPVDSPLPEECNLTLRGNKITGRITSVASSPALGKIIGLAYVATDKTEAGSSFDIKLSSGECISATVVTTPFYDPANQRQEL